MPWDVPYTSNKNKQVDPVPYVKTNNTHNTYNKKPNKEKIKRASPSARGYDSKWKALRNWWLRRHPLCLHCKKPATDVDHIIPFQSATSLEEREKLRLSMDNLRSLCKSCHAKVTRAYYSNRGA